MDKGAIQKYAIWARNELIEQVKQRAYQYGITDKGYGDENAALVGGRVLTLEEKQQRHSFVVEVKKNGFQQAVEEVAYTWFNRFVALRFMEVNDYLPTHVRVFSDASGGFNPEILKDVLHLELDGLDREKVSELLNANQTEELYRYLLLTQCNALNVALPEMFEKLGSYTEMLLPNNILKQDSVLARLVNDIDEDDWKDAVQIIGWMYQYYISDKHDEVIDPLRGKSIKKEDIPAATQLFTTDWVVRYMVDNSLGRYWIERHPESKLREKLDFFFVPKSGEISYVSETVSPQELTFFDPCMGSGHILVYAFDVLMEIYKECGYGERDAASEIVKNNIFGLDIDERCSQLAYFAVMMKARSYDRRFLTRGIKPHVLSIRESNSIGTFTRAKYMPDEGQNKVGEYLVDVFCHAKEIGSLKTVRRANYESFQKYLTECSENAFIDIDFSIWQTQEMPLMKHLTEQAIIMSGEYTVVCTNPPYMGKLESHLRDFVISEYKPYSGDLFSVFMFRNFGFCKSNGYTAFMTPNVWMSIKSYQALREYVMREKCIIGLVQMAHGAFNEVACVDVCSFIIKNNQENKNGLYIKLSGFKGNMDIQGDKCLFAIKNDCDYTYSVSNDDLMLVPGSPITAFCASSQMLHLYEKSLLLEQVAEPKQGIATSDNNKFLRLWFEVDNNKLFLSCSSHEEANDSSARWFPYNKGGNFRKWYGNNDYVIDWENNGQRLKNFKGAVLRNPNFYFRECISWSLISSYTIAFRYKPLGHLFDVAGMSCYQSSNVHLKYLLALNNCCLIGKIMMMLAPTINYQVGNIANIPVIYDEHRVGEIVDIVEENIALAKDDWDAYETSWDFHADPLCRLKASHNILSEAYSFLRDRTNELFCKLHGNEEYLNDVFLEIYDVVGEMPNTVSRRDVSHTFIYDAREEITEDIKESYYVRTKADLVRNFISYAVGCMFGRYSLDVDGLAYASGVWDKGKYRSFIPDKDNILPICDDEYFDDDILGRFVDFIRVVYGAETLDENLKFIADALGGKGTPREVIRNYFLNDFYKDHCKIYQKRPIYWLFDSGKKNGFKALIYLHRYSRDLLAKLRTDYVHEQQERYRTQLSHISAALNTATGSERARLLKQQDKLSEQLKEVTVFEEKVHHLADQNIEIDLDEGVKKNYKIFGDVLAKI